MVEPDLPGDIDPTSGSRLPLPRREDLDPRGQAVYDELADPDGDSLVGLRGPGGIRLHSPAVAFHMRALHQHFRHESPLPAAVREVAILVTAREHDSAFEWAAHAPQARREGVDAATIEAIRDGQNVAELDVTDALVITLGRQMFRHRCVDEGLFASARTRFGAAALVDLVSLMGLYAATASLLAAFDMQVPPGSDALPPQPG